MVLRGVQLLSCGGARSCALPDARDADPRAILSPKSSKFQRLLASCFKNPTQDEYCLAVVFVLFWEVLKATSSIRSKGQDHAASGSGGNLFLSGIAWQNSSKTL